MPVPPDLFRHRPALDPVGHLTAEERGERAVAGRCPERRPAVVLSQGPTITAKSVSVLPISENSRHGMTKIMRSSHVE